jgi:hypothetical protein
VIYRSRRTELIDQIGSGKRSLPVRARRCAVVLPAVAEVLRADLVFGVHGEAAYRADQCQVGTDGYAAVVEKHVVVGAQTQYVFRNIGSVVRSAKWANVCGLRVRAG